MNLTEKPLSSEYPYRGKIVNMRVDQALLPNGRQAVREVVEHPGGCAWPPSPTGRSCCLSGSSAIRIRRRFWNCLRASAPPERTRWNAASGS